MASPQNYLSVSRRPLDIEDYIDMFRRYRAWVIGPMFVGLVVSVVVAFLWPDTYVSQAVMRIMPQAVPANLVPSVVSIQMQDRINQMETEILSRTSLSEIINKPSLDLYKKEKAHRPLEDIIEDMKNKYITIRMVEMPGAQGQSRFASAFLIRFEYTDKYKAQAVVRELVSKFDEQNFNVQKNQAAQTNTFLTDEMKRAKDKLDELEAKVTRFKLENRGKLPEEFQTNVQNMNTLELRLGAMEDAISRDSQEKMILDSNLQTVKSNQNFASNNLEMTVQGQTVKNQRLIDLNKAILDARTRLAAELQTYDEGYPAIKQMRDSISVLEKERDTLEQEDQTNVAAGPTKVTNPQVLQTLQNLDASQKSLQANILAKNMEIAAKTKQAEELRRMIAQYQLRIEAAPANEQQYVALMHDYNLAREEYDNQAKKLNVSDTARNLEEHKAGENLEVLDPASFPLQPAAPQRLIIAGAGTAIGLVVGIVLAGVKELKNTSLKNLKDVRAYTNLPVLSSIPLLENALLVRRKRRLFWLAWSSATIVGCTAMFGSMYYYYFGQG